MLSSLIFEKQCIIKLLKLIFRCNCNHRNLCKRTKITFHRPPFISFQNGITKIEQKLNFCTKKITFSFYQSIFTFLFKISVFVVHDAPLFKLYFKTFSNHRSNQTSNHSVGRPGFKSKFS